MRAVTGCGEDKKNAKSCAITFSPQHFPHRYVQHCTEVRCLVRHIIVRRKCIRGGCLCLVCSLYLDAETLTMRYSAAGKRVRTEKKKRKKKKTSLRVRACAWWEELHSAAAHASLSQRPSLTKICLILDVDYPAILPTSFVVCSVWNLFFLIALKKK